MQNEAPNLPDEADARIEGEFINIVDAIPDIPLSQESNRVLDLDVGDDAPPKADMDPTAEQISEIQAKLARDLASAGPDDVVMFQRPKEG
jgi:hypothetical protein